MKFNYGYSNKEVDLSSLAGLTIASVDGLENESEEVIFNLKDGRQFKMHHRQICCECVLVDDVCGDIEDLIDTQIVHFEERTNEGDHNELGNGTWTFYDIQTTKGCVNIKWFGCSNGNYSEAAYVEWGIENESI
jgi:hypothetical protein